MKRATAAVPAGAHEPRLVAMGKVYVRFAIEHPAEFRVMFGESGTHARDPRLRLPTVERSPYEQVEDAVRQWAGAAGLELDVTTTANAFWCGQHGVARLVVDGALELSPTQSIALSEEVSRRMIAGYGRR
jgi:hypothetical protein